MSKEEFVDGLTQWFEELQEQGNTELYNIKSNCTSKSCCNKGSEVIIFVANKTREHIAFNFDIFQHRIINITECKTFNFYSGPEMKCGSLQKYKKYYWEPTDFYDQYIKELYPHINYLPNIDEIKYWVEKVVYNKVYGYEHKEFGLIRNFMTNYIELHDISPHVVEAMYQLKKINKIEEAESLEWLVHNEKIYFACHLVEYFSAIFSEYNNDATYLGVYKIDLSNCEIIEDFMKAYCQDYDNACNKFADLYNDQWFCKYDESLFYALKKLELIKDFDDSPEQEICEVDRIKLRAFNQKIINSNQN